MKVTKKNVHKQPSFQFKSSTVEAYVTEQGGHLAPVIFDRAGRKIQPFSIAPWAEEKVDPALPEILKVLRGDFFCMPFGGNEQPFKSEKFPVHGETANNKWNFESLHEGEGRTILHLSMDSRMRKGRVDKLLTLVDGHNAVYCRHVLSGMTGPMNIGHHATLKFPDEPGCGIVSFSPFRFGQVFVEPAELPENRGYSLLRPGYEFTALNQVATNTKEMADLTRYPARRGFEDIVQIISDTDRDVAWTAVSFPKHRYVWFALKDPKVLNSTLMWMSNGGRHYPPWSGRHVNVMGLEEITGYFHYGIAASAKKNSHNEKGVATVIQLKPNKPTVVNYIMAVAPTPAHFTGVKQIVTNERGCTLIAESGKSIKVPINAAFLKESV